MMIQYTCFNGAFMYPRAGLSWVLSLLPRNWLPSKRLDSLPPTEKYYIPTPILDFKPLDSIFEGLAGTTLVIPSLEELSPTWTMSRNPHHQETYDDFTKWEHEWFAETRLRKKIEDLDAPLFAAMAYPRTGYRELLTLSKWIAWYFPWDDGTGVPHPACVPADAGIAIDDAALMTQPADVERYRDETIAVLTQSIGPDTGALFRPHANPAIESFRDLGIEVRSQGTPHSNQEVIKHQSAFIRSSAASQIERKLDLPVSVEAYLKRREDNIAIYPLMALIHYAYKIELPAKYTYENNKHMKSMWSELARMGTMANDILSLRRELMHGQYESLVPLLMYHNNLHPQAAVQLGTRMIHDSYKRFYASEQALYKEMSGDEIVNMEAYLHACKDLIMCNLHWSYGLKRYMEKDMVQEDGSVKFDIVLPSKPVK